ncbi:MAG: hypothetical protein NTU44_09800 [Bacteroidetes bacterium]|nr:hypothetical protein [Bacteroidota bacterium]
MNEQLMIAVTVAVVFFGIYQIIKVFTDFLLKRKIIKAGHIDKAGILDPLAVPTEEKSYPTLKWGLVALSAGLGFIVIELCSNAGGMNWIRGENSLFPFGIELVFISAGFLVYFFYVNLKKK